MTDFLTRLAQRQLGEIPTIQPRLPALYAPVADEATLGTTTEIRTAPAFRAEYDPPDRIGRPGSRAPVKELKIPPTPLTAPASGQPQPASREHPPVGTRRVGAVGGDAAESPEKPDLLNRKGFKEADIPEAPVDLPSLYSAAPASSRTQLELTANESQSAIAQLVAAVDKTAPPPPVRLIEKRVSGRTAPSKPRASLQLPVPPRLSPEPERLPDKDTAEPPVQVNIGRIEITAVTAPSAPRRAAAPRKPSMSLDDYLARQQRRERE